MLSEQSLSFEKQEVSVIICQGIPYFQASTVTAVLGYADSQQAVRKNVAKGFVITLKELRLQSQETKPSGGRVGMRAERDPY